MRRIADESTGPAAVLVDDFVDFGHQADGVGQGDDDFVVVGDVVRGEDPPFTVLEPFLADLVAADVEVPDLLGNAAKACGLAFSPLSC